MLKDYNNRGYPIFSEDFKKEDLLWPFRSKALIKNYTFKLKMTSRIHQIDEDCITLLPNVKIKIKQNL